MIACLTASTSGNGELLRKASRAARESGGQLYAVMFDQPRWRLRFGTDRSMIDDAIMASYHGAKVTWIESSDALGELMRLARREHVGRIFVSRTRSPHFFGLFGRDIYRDLLRRAEGLAVNVVGFETPQPSRRHFPTGAAASDP